MFTLTLTLTLTLNILQTFEVVRGTKYTQTIYTQMDWYPDWCVNIRLQSRELSMTLPRGAILLAIKST